MNAKRKRSPVRPFIVAVGGGKGGTGKTSIAAHLAVEGLRQRRKVLVVDADEQRSLSTWSEIALEREVVLRPQLVQMGETLRSDIARVAEPFDLVLIDCPGVKLGKDGAERVVAAAYSVADYVLMPVAPGPTDVWTLHASVEAVRNVRALRPELEAGIVLNRLGRNGASRTLGDAVAGLDVPILRARLRQLETVSNALAAGEGVTAYKPRSEAAAEFSRLYKEIVRKHE